MDFASLDPHQKAILSDDFGVAVTTQWLYDRLGGFTDIVDGRRFMLQFAHLLPRKQKPAAAKVGPTKAPDFVIRDHAGKWHVLECKGTQSGRGWRNTFLKHALAQKNVIRIAGPLRGQSLAAGLAISNEGDKYDTHLRVVDPEPEPLITLNSRHADEIRVSARRIAVARALGVIGLNEAAEEMTAPTEALGAEEFMRPAEVTRSRTSREDRFSRASRQMRERGLEPLTHRGERYEGRRGHFRVPEMGGDGLFNVINVRQGVKQDLLREISSLDEFMGDRIDASIDNRMAGTTVTVGTEGSKTVLEIGGILFAELVLKRE